MLTLLLMSKPLLPQLLLLVLDFTALLTGEVRLQIAASPCAIWACRGHASVSSRRRLGRRRRHSDTALTRDIGPHSSGLLPRRPRTAL